MYYLYVDFVNIAIFC